MKFTGGGGGTFVSFKNVGDKYSGTVAGAREIPNKMNPGTMQTVIDLVAPDGTKLTVALGPKALQAAYAAALQKYGTLLGRFVTFEFERTYKPKNGGNLGKEISVDVREDGAPATTGGAPANAAIEAAYKTAVEFKGEATAQQIRKAVESVEKDPAKQAEMLLKAVKAA